MPIPFDHTLRSLEIDARSWRPASYLVPTVLLAAWLAWFCLEEVPRYEVALDGRVVAAAGVHEVAPAFPGRVARRLLRLGDRVEAGQVLLELEAPIEAAALGAELERRRALTEMAARLRDRIAAMEEREALHVEASRQLAAELAARLEEARAAAELAGRQAHRQRRLLEQGLVPAAAEEAARLAAEQRRAALEALERRAEGDLSESAAAQSDRRSERAALASELAEVEGRERASSATLARLRAALDARTLRAPVAGRIGEVSAVAAGDLVGAGQRLAVVVAARELRVEARFPAGRALGRVRPGQRARVLLRDRPAAELTPLSATVERVGAEARGDAVQVELALGADRSQLQHGLPVAVLVEVERVTPAVAFLRAAGGRWAERMAQAPPPAAAASIAP